MCCRLDLHLLNSVQILHASAFPDVHLCGINTSRLRRMRKYIFISFNRYCLNIATKEVKKNGKRGERGKDRGSPQVCGRPRRLSLGYQGSSSQFYPFFCRSCRWNQAGRKKLPLCSLTIITCVILSRTEE